MWCHISIGLKPLTPPHAPSNHFRVTTSPCKGRGVAAVFINDKNCQKPIISFRIQARPRLVESGTPEFIGGDGAVIARAAVDPRVLLSEVPEDVRPPALPWGGRRKPNEGFPCIAFP